MELIKVINARKVLDGLAEREDMCAQLAYWMTKFIVKTEDEQSFYVGEVQKLFGKYAKTNDENALVVPKDNVQEFNAEIDKLNGTEVEDPMIRFKLSELAELKLSMKQMYSLLDFIDEDK